MQNKYKIREINKIITNFTKKGTWTKTTPSRILSEKCLPWQHNTPFICLMQCLNFISVNITCLGYVLYIRLNKELYSLIKSHTIHEMGYGGDSIHER